MAWTTSQGSWFSSSMMSLSMQARLEKSSCCINNPSFHVIQKETGIKEQHRRKVPVVRIIPHARRQDAVGVELAGRGQPCRLDQVRPGPPSAC
jgi:hypothetical protein